MSEALGTWIDGVAGAQVPADDRGLQYGDGVFETVLIRRGIPRFLAVHRARLGRGLHQLGIPFEADAELNAEIAAAAAMAPALAILKVIVTRGSARRGYAPGGEIRARRIVSLWHATPLADEVVTRGAVLDVAKLRVPEFSPFAGLKHLNRLENVMAAREISGGDAFEALLLDGHERVVSGISCNVFIVRAGVVLTPPVDRTGVAGVMRQIVLREAPRLGIAAREQVLALEDVWSADGMFITNARMGVVPVRRVREHAFGMTEIANRLRNAIEALDA
ncbi:MAG TPA: aminodeoxychorismate lyase [Steroidobacteraceae bacterium]|nr:aminodeoxychorismate lyase [Steroidobacteraceae bacterium]